MANKSEEATTKINLPTPGPAVSGRYQSHSRPAVPGIASKSSPFGKSGPTPVRQVSSSQLPKQRR